MNDKKGIDVMLTTIVSVVLAIMLAATAMSMITKGCESLTVRSRDSLESLAARLDAMDYGTAQHSFEVDVGSIVAVFPPKIQQLKGTLTTVTVDKYASYAAGTGAAPSKIPTQVPLLAAIKRPPSCPLEKSCLCMSLEYLDMDQDELYQAATVVSGDTREIAVQEKFYCYTLESKAIDMQQFDAEPYLYHRGTQGEQRTPIIFATKRQTAAIEGGITKSKDVLVLCAGSSDCWSSIQKPTSVAAIPKDGQVTIYAVDEDFAFEENSDDLQLPEQYHTRIPYTRQVLTIINTFEDIFGQVSYTLSSSTQEYVLVEVLNSGGAYVYAWKTKGIQPVTLTEQELLAQLEIDRNDPAKRVVQE